MRESTYMLSCGPTKLISVTDFLKTIKVLELETNHSINYIGKSIHGMKNYIKKLKKIDDIEEELIKSEFYKEVDSGEIVDLNLHIDKEGMSELAHIFISNNVNTNNIYIVHTGYYQYMITSSDDWIIFKSKRNKQFPHDRVAIACVNEVNKVVYRFKKLD